MTPETTRRYSENGSPPCDGHRKIQRYRVLFPFVAFAITLGLTACQQKEEERPPEIRPVRTVTVAKEEGGQLVTLTGHIQAEDEAALSFRVSGRMIERSANVGDRVTAGQVVARL